VRSACAGEGLDETVGDLRGFLVRDKVAGAGDGDHGRVRAFFERAPFGAGEPAVAFFRVHDPGWHSRAAQPGGERVVTAVLDAEVLGWRRAARSCPAAPEPARPRASPSAPCCSPPATEPPPPRTWRRHGGGRQHMPSRSWRSCPRYRPARTARSPARPPRTSS